MGGLEGETDAFFVIAKRVWTDDVLFDF